MSACGGDAVSSRESSAAPSSQNGRVYAIDLSEVYTSGVRTAMGLNHIGRSLCPELYGDAE